GLRSGFINCRLINCNVHILGTLFYYSGISGCPYTKLIKKGEIARDFAAAQVKVSGRSVSKAEMVLKKGEPKLVEKVEQGEISIHLASQIVSTSI
ncbi:MAG: hypothetical protein GX639_02965, partial [Fibrobacter sp.]|nr:hypothetical protein [Fibrobacter sp.]